MREVASLTLSDWLAVNANLLTLLFGGLVALATVASVAITRASLALTRGLVAETTALRQAETEPAIGVYFLPGKRWVGFVHLVVENHGRGAARDLAWEVDCPPEEFARKGAVNLHDVGLFKGLSYLAPGAEIAFMFGTGPALLSDPPLEPFTIRAKFATEKGERREAAFHLNIKEFDKLRNAESDPGERIARSLENISKALNNLKTR